MRIYAWLGLVLTRAAIAADAATSQSGTPQPILAPPLPDVGYSLLRLAGAMAIVLAIFLGGAWLFRNWQRVVAPRGRAPKLAVLEVKPLGQRHALYVVAYERERLLLSASPTGGTLVSHLPQADASEPIAPGSDSAVPSSFAAALDRLRHPRQ